MRYAAHPRIIAASIALMLLPLIASAQAPVTLSPVEKRVFLGTSGLPLASGCVFTYIAGTTTNQASYIDSGGVTQNTNPVILDAAGRADIWLDTTKAYKFKIVSAGGVNCASGVTQYTVDNITSVNAATILGANNVFTGNNTFSGTNTFANPIVGNITGTASGGLVGSPSITVSGIDGIPIIDGTVYPLTNAGIQAAINAAPDGGMVMLGPGTYVLTGVGAEEILITKKLNFICSGWATVLQVSAAVPATTDVIHIKPSALVQGGTIKDCYIAPASGTPGRHGISIDGATAALSNFRFIHNRIDALGGKSIAVINATGLTTGTPFTSTFADNVTQGGWDFTNAGDSVNVENNTITGSGGFNWFPVGATVQPASNGGAHGFYFKGNNFTNTGGIWIQNAWQGTIAYNNIEVANLVNISGNTTCIDLDGNTAGNIENFKVIGNFIGCANGVSNVSQVRVNRANSSYISANFAARSVGVTYAVTANANATQIVDNRQAPTGEQITAWLSDSGTKTNVCYFDAVTFDRACTNFSVGTNGSVNRIFGTTGGAQVKVASGIPFGFSSGSDVVSTGLDAALSRLGAASVAVGNGTAGDTTGNLGLTTISFTLTLFANLGAPANGTFKYCADCTIANPCAGGGTGALAKRLNGIWVCN